MGPAGRSGCAGPGDRRPPKSSKGRFALRARKAWETAELGKGRCRKAVVLYISMAEGEKTCPRGRRYL